MDSVAAVRDQPILLQAAAAGLLVEDMGHAKSGTIMVTTQVSALVTSFIVAISHLLESAWSEA